MTYYNTLKDPIVCGPISPYLDWIEDIVWLGGNGTNFLSNTTTSQTESPLANRTFVKSEKRIFLFQKLFSQHFNHFMFQSAVNTPINYLETIVQLQ